MRKIINMTQHIATPEQIAQGVFEPENKREIQSILTFDTIPSDIDLQQRARYLAKIAAESGVDFAMIGGAPFFMSHLEYALLIFGVKPIHAFSVRESAETVGDDGTVTKTNVFKHVGFVGL